jgi:hypothetical protein
MNKFSYCWCYDNSGVKMVKILNSFKKEKILVNSLVNVVIHKLYPIKEKYKKYILKKKKYYGKVIALKKYTNR